MIALSGLLWLTIGTLLLYRGYGYLTNGILHFQSNLYPLITGLSSLTGGIQEAVILIIFTSLMIGIVKSKLVLNKAAKKVICRIFSLPNPAPFFKMFSPQYWCLYAFMMSLGIFLRTAGVPLDILGFINATVGSALINSSVVYFNSVRSIESVAK